MNCFPQTNQDYRVLLATLAKLLNGLSDGAIISAAERFASGDVPNQSKTFAPAVPEFVAEVRNQAEVIAIRQRPRLSEPRGYVPGNQELPGANARMRLKMPMYAAAFGNGPRMDDLARANREGFGAMVVLATNCGVAIPQELLDRTDAEDEWRRAHNRAWAEIERNPPPFMREKAGAAQCR